MGWIVSRVGSIGFAVDGLEWIDLSRVTALGSIEISVFDSTLLAEKWILIAIDAMIF